VPVNAKAWEFIVNIKAWIPAVMAAVLSAATGPEASRTGFQIAAAEAVWVIGVR
jgi:hypothetical protein